METAERRDKTGRKRRYAEMEKPVANDFSIAPWVYPPGLFVSSVSAFWVFPMSVRIHNEMRIAKINSANALTALNTTETVIRHGNNGFITAPT